MDIKEIREMSEKDLRERIETSRAALNQMLLNHAVSPLENTSQIKKAKKDITRMLTVLTEIENKKQSK
ncbi:MAG: 50S ribosomal protein L29 [Bacteroidales bacterium]|jgi:large subunit ribosomal protein L29|nr:50S ribosomal protein L29 [Bacteroidales bacterium]MBQ1886565.1 50S ribosomal protein L29 [Bacteroidales bacterium]MBQ2493569.1 50S ribosomal protein L29 [Bacteroidales bacterium]MBQ4197692.1 50S ribosomal protein L29 [Bacteroidales bacterium]